MEIKDLSIVKKHYRGKVRDIYDLDDKLLIVTSDRVSAFDVVFPTLIPNKGKILNQISVHFFESTKEIVSNHFVSADVNDFPEEFHTFKEQLEDRSMLVKKTRVIPFECIVRGYITGSGWSEYQKQGTVGGMIQAEGLRESQRLHETLFTPSTKAEEGHDVNISYKEMLTRIDHKIGEFLKDKSLELYEFGHQHLFERGILLADTKFEFGTIKDEIILIDEVLTPDSSRFWDKDDYQIGSSPKSYDKQFIRDYIVKQGWDKKPPAPELPTDVVKKTYEKYYQVYERIVGNKVKVW